jgi:WD40 repeat protein
MDCNAFVYDADSGEMLHILLGHTACVTAIKFVDQLDRIVTCSVDTQIKIWTGGTADCLFTIQAHTGPIKHCISTEVEGYPVVITASDDSTIRLWNVENSACLRVLTAHEKPITALEMTEDGRIVSGSVDTMIKIHQL